VRTIEDLITFPGGAEASRQIKSLVFFATIDGEPRPVLDRTGNTFGPLGGFAGALTTF
jgi:hypothetical protein